MVPAGGVARIVKIQAQGPENEAYAMPFQRLDNICDLLRSSVIGVAEERHAGWIPQAKQKIKAGPSSFQEILGGMRALEHPSILLVSALGKAGLRPGREQIKTPFTLPGPELSERKRQRKQPKATQRRLRRLTPRPHQPYGENQGGR